MEKKDWLWQEGQRRAKKSTKGLMPLAYFTILIVFLGMFLGSLWFNINSPTAL